MQFRGNIGEMPQCTLSIYEAGLDRIPA